MFPWPKLFLDEYLRMLEKKVSETLELCETNWKNSLETKHIVCIKHAMCQLVVVMLREQRIHVHKPLVSKDEKSMLLRLREQMEVYSYQFKLGTTTFQKDRIALSGKVGGMKDDICICLQLACYHTQLETQRAMQGLTTD